MRLPSISERKSLYLLESKCKQRPVPSDGFQPKSLNKIFSEYVLPSVNSRGETPGIEFKESLNKNRKVHSHAKKSFTVSQSVSILHDNLVYSSARDSHAIVCKNKQVYEKMQQAMKAAELQELHAALLSCKEQQRLLKLLTQHTRVEQTEEAKEKEEAEDPGNKLLNLYLIGLSKLTKKKSSAGTITLTVVITTIKGNRPYIPMPNKWVLHEISGCRPETREGATLTRIGVSKADCSVEERLYLFGGLGRGLLSVLSYFCVTANGNSMSILGLLLHVPVEDGNEKRKRFGHAASTWDGMLIVVGGSKYYNKATGRRECMNDVLVYNPGTSQWTELQCADGALFEQRRYHAASVVGRYLIVHGGISTFDKYLGSIMGMTLGKAGGSDWRQRTYKWFDLRVQGYKPKKLAFHTMQLVLQRERYRALLPMDLFALPEIRGLSNRVEYEGLYLFGGRDEKEPKNDLYIITIGKSILKWIVPKVAGKSPSPRYGHSMNYYPDKSILVVFGGRNDSNFDKYGHSYMNDVWILYLEKLTWCRWDTQCSFAPMQRYSHCAELAENTIVLFGGLSEENYCNAEIYALDLDGTKRVAVEEDNTELVVQTSQDASGKSRQKAGATSFARKAKDCRGSAVANRKSSASASKVH